jgi:hypothetical protein
MSLLNSMLYGEYKTISKQEYYDWFKDASIIENERCVFSSFCGPHEFCTIIGKKGTIYDLGWGWHVENGETIEWYGVRTCSMDHNQNGDGI